MVTQNATLQRPTGLEEVIGTLYSPGKIFGDSIRGIIIQDARLRTDRYLGVEEKGLTGMTRSPEVMKSCGIDPDQYLAVFVYTLARRVVRDPIAKLSFQQEYPVLMEYLGEVHIRRQE